MTSRRRGAAERRRRGRAVRLLVTAAVTLSLATIGVVSIASAAPNNQLDSTTAQTLTVLGHATDFEMVNVNGKEIGPGDSLGILGR